MEDIIKKEKQGLIYGIVSIIFLVVYFVMLMLNSNREILMYSLLLVIFIFLNLSVYHYYRFVFDRNQNNKNEVLKIKNNLLRDLKDISRNQRHDYMNVLQIVYGNLQLKKNDEAINHIKKASNITSSISRIHNISIPSICLLLDVKTREAYNKGIIIYYDIKKEIESEYRYLNNEEFLIFKMKKIINYLLDKYDSIEEDIKVKINIKEEKDSLEISFCENLLLNEFENLLKIYSCTYKTNNELKIVFPLDNPKQINPTGTILEAISKSEA